MPGSTNRKVLRHLWDMERERASHSWPRMDCGREFKANPIKAPGLGHSRAHASDNHYRYVFYHCCTIEILYLLSFSSIFKFSLVQLKIVVECTD